MQCSVAIIGLGNWGSSLAHAITRAGIPLDEVVVRRGTSPAKTSFPLTTLGRARLKADVLWLCVPDSAIATVVAQLVKKVAKRGLTGQTLVHSSGVFNAQLLHQAAKAGAATGSVHPLMSFPTRTPVRLKGTPFAVEAEGASSRLLSRLVRRIGGRPFPIEGTHKELYHAVGVLSSPLLVSHLNAAMHAAALAGFSSPQARRLVEPISRATLDNFFRDGSARSFSGPIARGDVETIHLHLQALKSHPMLAGVYRSLAAYALDTLPSPRTRALRAALQQKE